MKRIKLKPSKQRRISFPADHAKPNNDNSGATPVTDTATEKKTAPKKKRKSKAALVQEPVVVRVRRTVTKKANHESSDSTATTNQENPGQDSDGAQVDPETIEIRPFVTEPAKVTYSYGISRSVQFQSVNVGVSVTIPCYKEEIEDAIAEAKEICAARLKLENGKIDGVLNHLVNLRIKADQELNNRGIA